MDRVTNNAGLDLGIAVWLAMDEYKYDDRPNAISTTALIKPLKPIILAKRVPEEERIPDVLDNVKRAMGHILHSGIERAWTHAYATSLAKLGLPKRVIDAVRINPETIEPDTVPVFTECGGERTIVVNGTTYIVTGTPDLIIDWRLRDAKSTTVWVYQNQSSDGSWQLQGSIYRWIHREKITHDELLVQYLLTDWSRALAKRDPSYPPHAVPSRAIPLLNLGETERYIRNKLAQIEQYRDAPEEQIPECTDEELWRTAPVWKYYANPEATGRSTKNFLSEADARQFMASKGGKGRIDHVPGEVKACLYCPAFPVCKQKDRYIADGSLKP